MAAVVVSLGHDGVAIGLRSDELEAGQQGEAVRRGRRREGHLPLQAAAAGVEGDIEADLGQRFGPRRDGTEKQGERYQPDQKRAQRVRHGPAHGVPLPSSRGGKRARISRRSPFRSTSSGSRVPGG